METTNGYVVIYNGKNHDVYASDLWAAKKKFIGEQRIPKSKQGLVSVIPAEKDVPFVNGKPGVGTQVVHSTSGL